MNIIIGITGSIAAYKSAQLVRLLQNHSVQVVMSAGAHAFITPLTLQALTGNSVHETLLDAQAEAGMGHIELARWADLVVIAPCSANTMANLAHGMANDLLTTLCLATHAPIAYAPAMNAKMWAHPATQKNASILAQYGYHVLAPQAGVQACGDIGVGRMMEPEALAQWIEAFACYHQPNPNQDIAHDNLSNLAPNMVGATVIISAGATIEAIDPVRYLSNHSSGKMGFALANSLAKLGANVHLLAQKNIAWALDSAIVRHDISSADDLLDKARTLMQAHPNGAYVSAAAVADYKVQNIATQKIKKNADTIQLTLVKNPDVLTCIAHEYPQATLIGFAAETHDTHSYAKQKLDEKKLDMIAMNDVSRSDIGFGSDDNAMTLYFADGRAVEIDKMRKSQVADVLAVHIAQIWQQKRSLHLAQK